MKSKRTQSNVYADIGVKDPEAMQMKAQLALEIGEIIRRRKLSQIKAAEIGIAAGFEIDAIAQALEGHTWS